MGHYDIHQLLDDNDDTVGGRMAAARDIAGYDMRKLAALTGISVETLRIYEADRAELPERHVKELAKVLKVDARWLMSGRGTGPCDDDNHSPQVRAMRGELESLMRLHEETGKRIAMLHRRLNDMELRAFR
ncbi:helix-turn-helix transcriptional regulator [Allorhizobium sp. BGMRC 0089]|uniref:helix-turn-helix domain-containing protein n=1 Tax=Allorhizobium sonneratiae TaxID=2934936 RepID=UPI0020335D55|nr:helix-turn-helix transcriptional regulator [Allorhizobium sonneratiae]MCM2292265.1 helix-turn-helix transcriptional regulator [Allorhizobium sonneratiae]